MTKPTVGRIVVYHEDHQELAAIICHVWDDSYVNLVVFSSNGTTYPATDVYLSAAGELPPNKPSVLTYAEWPKVATELPIVP